MTTPYAELSDAEKLQVQTLLKTYRDAARALVEAMKLAETVAAENTASALLLAKLDFALPIPRDAAVQGALSPFATADLSGNLMALGLSYLAAVYAVAMAAEYKGLWSTVIGPENVL